jgi:hypothetical protein
MIPTVVIIWFMCTGHRLYFYNIDSGSCGPLLGIYERVDAYFEAIMSGVVPPILFIILGSLLLKNVRQVARRRVAPTGPVSRAAIKNLTHIQQIDSQLSTMILLQSFIAIPSFLPFGAQNLYTSITLYWYKPPLYLAYENLFVELIRLFSYLFYSTSFYISFLSSRAFRKQILHSLGIKRYTHLDHSTNPIH